MAVNCICVFNLPYIVELLFLAVSLNFILLVRGDHCVGDCCVFAVVQVKVLTGTYWVDCVRSCLLPCTRMCVDVYFI